MNQSKSQNTDQFNQSNNFNDDNYENDDLITINLYYSQITKYSKHIRDGYMFLDVINDFPQEFLKFQEEYKISSDSSELFFQILHQNSNIKENSIFTYNQCVDLLKIFKYLKIRKLLNHINEYIKNRKNDVDYIIQMLHYENQTISESENSEIDINSEIEEILTSKIHECLMNEKFSELPISTIYRIVELSSKNKINMSDNLFDFIKKSVNKFYVLFQFVEIEHLSENKQLEMIDLYSKLDQNSQNFFNYMKFNLKFFNNLMNKKRNLQEKLETSENINNQQQNKMKEYEEQIFLLKKQFSETEQQQRRKMDEFEVKIEILQNQLNISKQENDRLHDEKSEIEKRLSDYENKLKNSEDEKNEIEKLLSDFENKLKNSEEAKNKIEKKLSDSENVKRELQKQLEEELLQFKGSIFASVKNGLIINAQLKLWTKSGSFDSTKSKYIISSSSAENLGLEAYEKGDPITSLEMSTIDFICKSGIYYVRCIVFLIDGKFKEFVSNPVTTSSESVILGYEGKPSSFSLPKGQYKLEVWGAKGGDSTGSRSNTSSNGKGGLGGYSRGILNLKENERIYVFVGGEGRPGDSSDGEVTSGGFPDGGGTRTGHYYSATCVPGTGGGSTSIRVIKDTNYHRVIVAGGGGGSSGDSMNTSSGGFGGGTSGGNCYFVGELKNQGSGTQTGSTCGLGCFGDGDPGEFGQGATGNYEFGSDSGGGGGGGWFGGGSGGIGGLFDCSSGGGGSGWIFTESSFNVWKSGDSLNSSKFLLDSSYYLTNALSVSGDKEFPRPDGNGTERGHSGNGYAKITPE